MNNGTESIIIILTVGQEVLSTDIYEPASTLMSLNRFFSDPQPRVVCHHVSSLLSSPTGLIDCLSLNFLLLFIIKQILARARLLARSAFTFKASYQRSVAGVMMCVFSHYFNFRMSSSPPGHLMIICYFSSNISCLSSILPL